MELVRRYTCMDCGLPFSPGVPEWVHRCQLCCERFRGRISKAKRRRIMERDNWICHLCGEPVLADDDYTHEDGVHQPKTMATLDHVLELARGGTNEESNLACAHRSCNNARNKGLAL